MIEKTVINIFLGCQMKFEKSLTWLIILMLVGALSLSLFSSTVLTLEQDEAWILENVHHLFGEQNVYPKVESVITTGGLYVLGEAIIHALFGQNLFMARLIPFASLCGILTCLYLLGKKWLGSPTAALILLSAFIAVPGTLSLSSVSYGVIPGQLCLMAAILVWVEQPGGSIKRQVGTGLLFGLAMATRTNFGLVFPAIVLTSLTLPKEEKRAELLDSAMICIVGIASGLLFMLGYALCLGELQHVIAQLFKTAGYTGPVLGSDGFLTVQRFFNRMEIANRFIPLILFAAATAIPWLITIKERAGVLALRMLSLFAWLMLVAWNLHFPHPFLRYLYPALGSVGVLGGFALASLYCFGKQKGHSGIVYSSLLLSCLCLISGGLTAYRVALVGNMDIVHGEWRAVIGVDTKLKLYQSRDNRLALAEYINQHEGKKIGLLDNTIPIRYEAKPTVLPFGLWVRDPVSPPDKLIRTPFSILPPNQEQWIRQRYEPEAQFGRYLVLTRKNSL